MLCACQAILQGIMIVHALCAQDILCVTNSDGDSLADKGLT